MEFQDGKQIKEPYLQVFAFLLSEFTGKTWDLKRVWIFAAQKSGTQCGHWRTRQTQKILAWNSVKYPWCLPVKCGVYPWNAVFTCEIPCLPEEKSHPMPPLEDNAFFLFV